MNDWRELLDSTEDLGQDVEVALDKLLRKRPIDGDNLPDLYPEERLLMWVSLGKTRNQISPKIATKVTRFVTRFRHKHSHWIL